MQVEVIPSNERTLSYADGLAITESHLAEVLLDAFGDPECPGCEETYDELTAQIFDAIEEKGFEVPGKVFTAHDILTDASADARFKHLQILEDTIEKQESVIKNQDVSITDLTQRLELAEGALEKQEYSIKSRDATIADLRRQLKMFQAPAPYLQKHWDPSPVNHGSFTLQGLDVNSVQNSGNAVPYADPEPRTWELNP